MATLQTLLTAVLSALTVLIVIATFLPMWSTNNWWVRILDFPRLQFAAAGAVVLLLAVSLLSGPVRVVIAVLMVAACGYQIWRVFPYTVFAPTEMTLAADGPHAVKVLAANVLMENERHDLLRGVIEDFDPDVLLLMETDQTWIDALEPVLEGYATVIREPKDDHYGMVFATRLAAEDARIVRLTTRDTPAVFAQLSGPGGTAFRFVGLHPRPPVPGTSTEERDAQIRYAARFAAKSGMPLIAVGDFNDVAWSDTSQMFKHVGRYLDPRIGRGIYSSFNAEKFYLRFPIDQFYVTEDVAVVSIQRQPYIGSDHFPMAATIRLDAELAARLNASPTPVDEQEERRIENSVARTRDALGHSKF